MVAAKALPLLVDPLLVATRPGTTSSLVKFIAFSVTESLRFAKDEAFKAQQEIQQRRRDPEAMTEYNRLVEERRRAEMAKGVRSL